jgi:hypothetical protein
LANGRLCGEPNQNWVEYDVEVPMVRRGNNDVGVALTKGETLLRALQLTVRYREA